MWKNYLKIAIRNLLQSPRILRVTTSTNKPGVNDHNGIQIRAAGSEVDHGIGIIYVDHDYVEALGLELAEGRGFSVEIPSDARHAVLINESARKMLGAEFGPGIEVELFWRQQERIVSAYDAAIVGVLEDFNHRPLYIHPQPIVWAIGQNDWHFRQALVRISPGNATEVTAFIEACWQRLFPALPFRSSFLDRDIERVYRQEKQWQTLFTYFAGLAIGVACLGLFGLAAFTAERRTKEIGIRKTLGASVLHVVLLLSKEFSYLVLAANIIAWPVAYWALNSWLQDYPYRIELEVWIFLLSGALALGIAWLTVSWQAVKAALSDPVEALRYE